ncbi:MAG: YmfQ family protein [Defluviitaleaceae bacterium]|nr:YmfQ family protein [Defluviitaleaceae bacterium]MCL2274491.1 YmfQ family protein [Defluviitaleaceae bacterium]
MNRLMEYLPRYYRDFVEMLDLTNAETPEMDRLWKAITRVLNNQFIIHAEASRVAQWERLLRIRPDTTTQTLDQRKEIVLMRLQMRLHFTYRWLQGFLADKSGEENVTTTRNIDAYALDIIIVYEDIVILQELYRHWFNSRGNFDKCFYI